MRGYQMQANERTELPAAHVVVDTETTSSRTDADGVEHHVLQLGCAVFWRREGRRLTRRQELTFTTPDQFWAWCGERCSEERSTWVWAYNLGFDLSILQFFREWEEGRWADKWHVLEPSPTVLSGHYLGKKVVLIDLHNLLPQGVCAIGEWVGLPKLPMPEAGATPAALTEYCQRDVEITMRGVNRWLDIVRDEDLGCLRYTLGGQALQHFRHLSGSVLPKIPKGQAEARLARASFYGARTDLYYSGRIDTDVYVVDVSSIYGHMMGTCLLPQRKLDYTRHGQCVDLGGSVDPLTCCARVWLQTEVPYPIRLAGTGTVYAVGDYVTTLAGPELAQALQAGHVRQVYELAAYRLDHVCRAFADHWWARRCQANKEGDLLMERVAKMMPPSLFGKFSQRSPRYQALGPIEGGELWGSIRYLDDSTGTTYRGRVLNGQGEVDLTHGYQVRLDGGGLERIPAGEVLERDETAYSFAAISAWITSYARLWMDRLRETAGEKNVYYQVCDCLHLKREGLERLQAAGVVGTGRRGDLKLKATHETVEYYGINLLRIDGEWQAAGLSGIREQLENGRLIQTTFERLDGLLARLPDGTVRIRTSEWQPRPGYDPGVVGADGWISPLRLATPYSEPRRPTDQAPGAD